jgi:hypothetical protein
VQVPRRLILVLAVLGELHLAPDAEHLGHGLDIDLVRRRQRRADVPLLEELPARVEEPLARSRLARLIRSWPVAHAGKVGPGLGLTGGHRGGAVLAIHAGERPAISGSS